MKYRNKSHQKTSPLAGRTDSLMWALPIVAWLISCAPFFFYGYPAGHDWTYELVRVAEYRHAWEAGQFPPYWAGNLYGGFGCPAFLFYAPLFSMISVVFSYITNSFETASLWVLVIFSGVGALSVSLMSRSAGSGNPHLEPATARIASYIYLLHPYLLCNKFLRNANAEFIALCLAPFAIYAVLLTKKNPRKGAVLLALSLGLTLLSHNLTAMTVMVLIIGYAFFVLQSRSGWRTALAVAGGAGLGLGLASFYWVPAFALKKFVSLSELLTGKFDFHREFKSLGGVFNYHEVFSIGLLTLLIFAAGIIALFVKRSKCGGVKKLLAGTLVAAAFSLFLVTKHSVAIWENVPLIDFFQFPWRMLGPLALLTAMGGALAYAILMAGISERIGIRMEFAVFLLCLANALPALAKVQPLPEAFHAETARYLTPESIRDRGMKVTVGDEYLPKGAFKDLWRSQETYAGILLDSSFKEQIKDVSGSGGHFSFLFQSTQPAVLPIARWNFPGWKIMINGAASEKIANRDGTFSVRLLPGRSLVECRYLPPPVRQGALIISAVSLILWLLLAASPFLRRIIQPSGKR
jgi:uncharacterized membrane protein